MDWRTWPVQKQLAVQNHPAVLDTKRWNSLLRAEGLVLLEALQGQGIAATVVSKRSMDQIFLAKRMELLHHMLVAASMRTVTPNEILTH